MISAGVVGYGAAALAFLVLVLLLWSSWKGAAQGLSFIVASAVSMLWAVAAAWHAGTGAQAPLSVMFTAEMARDGAWLIALTGLVRGFVPHLLIVFSRWVCFVLIGLVWMLPFVGIGASPSRLSSAAIIPAGVMVAVIVLLLIEQIYRNSNATGRFGFKFLAIGLGGAFTFDLFLYSQGLLFHGLSSEFWDARGFVNAALVPLIAIAARRNPQWSFDIFVSRQAVMFTTSVLAIGIYLLLMATGGYYLRLVGGSWGVIANLLFFTGAVVVLAVIVASGAVRRRVRVFLHKHFYRNKYDYRAEWLRFVATLASARGEDIRRASLKAIAQLFQCDGAVLYTRSNTAPEYVPSAAWPWPPGSEPRLPVIPDDHEAIDALRIRSWVIDMREYREAPEFYQNLELPAAMREFPGCRIAAPLLDADRLTGIVLLREPPPPFELTYEDRDLLLTAGRHVAAILAQQEAERRLAEGHQFEAYHRLTAFLMHDLKNLVAQLKLVGSNAERHRDNPRFVDDAFATVANASGRMGQLIAQLSRGEAPGGKQDKVVLQEVVAEAISRCSDRLPLPVLAAESPADEIAVMADSGRLASVVEHVIRNAQDASHSSGAIRLEIVARRDYADIVVRDAGAGMTEEFVRTRLFRPFDSTKGSKGMGIGAYQVREYVHALGGRVEVQSNPGIGTTFTIKLPRHG